MHFKVACLKCVCLLIFCQYACVIIRVNLNRGLRIDFKSKVNKMIYTQKHIFHLLRLSYFQVLGKDVRCFTTLTWG